MMLSRRLLESCSFSSKPGSEVACRIYGYKSSINTNSLSFRFSSFQNNVFTITFYLRVLNTVPHDLFPVFVNSLEKSSLLWNLLHDVLRGEDRLQIKPLGLHLQPFIYGFLDTKKTLLPYLITQNKLSNLCRTGDRV